MRSDPSTCSALSCLKLAYGDGGCAGSGNQQPGSIARQAQPPYLHTLGSWPIPDGGLYVRLVPAVRVQAVTRHCQDGQDMALPAAAGSLQLTLYGQCGATWTALYGSSSLCCSMRSFFSPRQASPLRADGCADGLLSCELLVFVCLDAERES